MFLSTNEDIVANSWFLKRQYEFVPFNGDLLSRLTPIKINKYLVSL